MQDRIREAAEELDGEEMKNRFQEASDLLDTLQEAGEDVAPERRRLKALRQKTERTVRAFKAHGQPKGGP